MGRWKEALENTNKAFELVRKLLGEETPQMAKTLHNLGWIQHKSGDSKSGLQNLQRALAIEEHLFGKLHPDIARTLSNMGVVYSELRDSKRGLEYLRRALEMERDVLGELHPDTTAMALSLAAALANSGNSTEAYEVVEEFMNKLPKSHVKSGEFRRLQQQLLARTMKPGFRQRGKGKPVKKKRR
jgi:tetratricopeptide (TPR) repeat protein